MEPRSRNSSWPQVVIASETRYPQNFGRTANYLEVRPRRTYTEDQHRLVHFAHCNLGRFGAPRFFSRRAASPGAPYLPEARAPLQTVARSGESCRVGAVRAAVKRAGALNPVADYSAATGKAPRSERLDRALKRVEGAAPPAHDDLKALIVVVSTNNTPPHMSLPVCPPFLGGALA